MNIITEEQKRWGMQATEAYELTEKAGVIHGNIVADMIVAGTLSKEAVNLLAVSLPCFPTKEGGEVTYSFARTQYKEGTLTSEQEYAFKVVRCFENYLSRECYRKDELLRFLTTEEKQAKKETKAVKTINNEPVTQEELQLNTDQAQANLEAGEVPQGIILDTSVINALRLLASMIKDDENAEVEEVDKAMEKVEHYFINKLGLTL